MTNNIFTFAVFQYELAFMAYSHCTGQGPGQYRE